MVAGTSPLQRAAQAGDAAAVDRLLARHPSAADMGVSLYLAAMGGSSSVVARLLRAGAPVDARVQRQGHALSAAAQMGHTRDVEQLLAAGADVAAANEAGQAALHSAAVFGHCSVLRLLLGAGAGVNQQDAYQQSPLCIAAGALQADAVALCWRLVPMPRPGGKRRCTQQQKPLAAPSPAWSAPTARPQSCASCWRLGRPLRRRMSGAGRPCTAPAKGRRPAGGATLRWCSCWLTLGRRSTRGISMSRWDRRGSCSRTLQGVARGPRAACLVRRWGDGGRSRGGLRAAPHSPKSKARSFMRAAPRLPCVPACRPRCSSPPRTASQRR